MLPINETIKIDGVKYKIESVETGYLINKSFVVYQDGDKWQCSDTLNHSLVKKLGKYIEDLIWFRASGV